MNSLYCWGDRLIPYPVLKKTTTHAIVEIDSQPRNIPLNKILGWCEWPYSKGDRVTVLMGSFWHSGTVGEGLSVALDNGRPCPIWSAGNVRSLYVPPPEPAYSFGSSEFPLATDNKPIAINDPALESIIAPPESVPMPELEDGLKEEFDRALEIVKLQPLKLGDRVRIVLAGPPLERLIGSLGTVEGDATFGLIPVNVDGYKSTVLRREQLELVVTSETMGIPIVSEVTLHSQVRHKKRWPGKSAELRPLVPT